VIHVPPPDASSDGSVVADARAGRKVDVSGHRSYVGVRAGRIASILERHPPNRLFLDQKENSDIKGLKGYRSG
jgi:hypothetical protein